MYSSRWWFVCGTISIWPAVSTFDLYLTFDLGNDLWPLTLSLTLEMTCNITLDLLPNLLPWKWTPKHLTYFGDLLTSLAVIIWPLKATRSCSTSNESIYCDQSPDLLWWPTDLISCNDMAAKGPLGHVVPQMKAVNETNHLTYFCDLLTSFAVIIWPLKATRSCSTSNESI